MKTLYFKIIFIFALLLNCSFALAEGDVSRFSDYRNFFGSSLMGADGRTGINFSYSYRLTDQLMIGTTLTFATYGTNSEGGDLVAGQYYKEKFEVKSNSYDFNATYFFQENGYARWGWLVRGAVGKADHSVTAGWGRYDKDPGFFIVGDGKRLQESFEVKDTFNSVFVRAGLYYQFVWGFGDESRLGHVLELGGSFTHNDKEMSFGYVKPNGDVTSYEAKKDFAVAEASYKIAF